MQMSDTSSAATTGPGSIEKAKMEACMYAEVVADEVTGNLQWECREVDGRGFVSNHDVVELAAKTFAVGTELRIYEPGFFSQPQPGPAPAGLEGDEASPSPIGSLNELDETREALGESRKVVSRVWAALGINTYDQAGGKAIDELVCHLREAVEFAHANGFEWPSDPIPWARNA